MPVNGLGYTTGPLPPGNPNDGAQRTERVESNRQEDAVRPQTGGPGDSIQISDEGRQAVETQESTDVGESEATRPDKVAAAREFPKAGLYNDTGVLEQTADSLAPFLNTQI